MEENKKITDREEALKEYDENYHLERIDNSLKADREFMLVVVSVRGVLVFQIRLLLCWIAAKLLNLCIEFVLILSSRSTRYGQICRASHLTARYSPEKVAF